MDLFFDRNTYLFDSPLTIREMIAALNGQGLWEFVERDSDRWGVYTSSCAERPGVAAVKIIEEDRREGEGRFLVSASYESPDPGAAEDWARFMQDLTERILPAIRAANVSQTSDYE